MPATTPEPHHHALPARYEALGLLGEGGMGVVYRVRDREQARELALKVFRPSPEADAETGRFLFKQEFWAMAALDHPHLIKAHDYGELEDGTPYLTMALVPGRDWLEGLPHDEAAVRAALPGVASALAYLHGRGYVHADLKPENVRIGPDGHVTLMDLGLLERIGRAGGAIKGSLSYLAPEAIRQGAIDGRTDFYALGAVLYHVLTGRPPFVNASPIGLLQDHLQTRPVPPRQLRPELTAELDAVIMRLLAKDPAGRFATATDLLAALGVEAHLAESAALLGSPVVGRDNLQAELDGLLSAPTAATWWLTGAAGAGKTRLLTEGSAAAKLAGTPVLQAQGLGADAPPYQALFPWLRALTAPQTPELARLAPILARLLPELGVEPLPALDGAQERIRLHGAIAELARAHFAGPRAWLVDDYDALDPNSQDLIGTLRRTGDGAPWVWLVTSLEAPAPEGADARHLSPLGEAEVLTLAGHLLGQPTLPPALAERLPELSGGLPGTIEALLEAWLREGALVRANGRWEAAPEARFELTAGLDPLLDPRFAALGPAAQGLLRAAAVLGARAELPWLAALVEGDFFQALAEAEAAGVLQRDDQAYRFARPGLVEALRAEATPEATRPLHDRAADWMLARVAPTTPEDAPLDAALAIARHRLAGASPLSGVPWAIAAASKAMALYAAAQAEPLVDLALAAPGLDPAAYTRLLGLRALALRTRGAIDPALALYDTELLPRLAEEGRTDAFAVEHRVTYGVLLMQKARYPEALAALADAINAADDAGVGTQAIRARVFAGRVSLFSGARGPAETSLKAAIRKARAQAEDGPTAESRAQALPLLASALSLYGYMRASGEPGAEAEGLAMLDEAIALNQRLGDLSRMHEALNNQGNVLVAMGRQQEARTVFETCLDLCRRMGSANDALIAHLNLGGVLLELGSLIEALAHADTALAMARSQRRQFPEGYALALAGLLRLYTGELAAGASQVDDALAIAQGIKNRYLELNVRVYQAAAELHLGRFEAAAETLAAARDLARATSNEEFNGRLDRLEAQLAVRRGEKPAGDRLLGLVAAARRDDRPTALAHALRWLAELRTSRSEWLEAERAALEALPLAHGAGLVRLEAELRLVLGTVADGLHRQDQAADHFEAARGLAEATGDVALAAVAGYHAGIARRDLPAQREAAQRLEQLASGLDPAGRAAFFASADRQALVAADGSGQAVSLGQMRHLTDLIAMITRSEDLHDVMQYALVGLVELARAERGFLVLYDGFEVVDQVFYGADAVDQAAFSNSLAQQVLWTGEPLFIEDSSLHGELAAQASIQALSLRSVLGLPLKDGAEVIGVMLADSQRINTRWSAADLELALALAQAVSLALVAARKQETAQGELETLRLLHRLALATAGMPDLEAFAAAALPEALALTGAERAFLLRRADGPLPCVAAHGTDGPLPTDSADLSQSICRWVLDHQEPLSVVDLQNEEAFQSARSVMALGLRTVYAVPVGDYGLLYLDSQRMVEAAPRALDTLARLGELAGAFASRA